MRILEVLANAVLLTLILWAARVWGWGRLAVWTLAVLAVLASLWLIAEAVERRERAANGGPAPHRVKRWEREHLNGRRSWVTEVPYREGHHEAGAIVLGQLTPFPPPAVPCSGDVVFATRADAQRKADELSECPQPCDCPGWRLVSRYPHK